MDSRIVDSLKSSSNQRFVAFMDEFLPYWRESKEELNRFHVAHLDWGIDWVAEEFISIKELKDKPVG